MSDETPEVTQRIVRLPGMAPGVVGLAGEDKSGPTVKVVAIPFWEYFLIDIALWAYVTGWITTSAFYGAGELEQHGLTHRSSGLEVLAYISLKAFIPAAILVMKDLGTWLYKRRQAHGLT